MDSVYRGGSHGRDIKPTLDDTVVISNADTIVILLFVWRSRLRILFKSVLGLLQPDGRAYAVQGFLSRRVGVGPFVADGTMFCDACSGISDGYKLVLSQILTMQRRMPTRREALGVRVIVLLVVRGIVAGMTSQRIWS
jgi:hypothetical protein